MDGLEVVDSLHRDSLVAHYVEHKLEIALGSVALQLLFFHEAL